jgi:hypothetical protein
VTAPERKSAPKPRSMPRAAPTSFPFTIAEGAPKKARNSSYVPSMTWTFTATRR